MGILDNLVGLIQSPTPVKDHSLWVKFNVLIYKGYKHTLRYFLRNYRSPKFIIMWVSALIIGYVMLPVIFPSEKKVSKRYSKRPDAFTTGFTNTGNDCFANSTLQALVPLWRFNDYFHNMADYELPDDAIKYPMPLHLSLLQLMRQMQTSVNVNVSVSVWDILHLLERIHQGKISRSQHDAHELFQMVVDTLEEEYLRFFSFYFKVKSEEERLQLKVQEPPAFPFSSVIESKLQCMRCKFTSAPIKNPMMILELNVPQDNYSTVSLEEMMKRSWNEVIEGYSCLVCNVKYMLLNRSTVNLTVDQEQLLDKLKVLFLDGTLKINDEAVEDPLYKAIISTNDVFKSVNFKTVVHRNVTFVKSPEILVIHLSRSIYEDSQAWRNSKTVTFNDSLELHSETRIPAKYSLRSVIRHHGTHSSGHYECYRKKPEFYKRQSGDDVEYGYAERIDKSMKVKKLATVFNKPFWRISDTVVTETSLDKVLNDGLNAYMLVYEKVKT